MHTLAFDSISARSTNPIDKTRNILRHFILDNKLNWQRKIETPSPKIRAYQYFIFA